MTAADGNLLTLEEVAKRLRMSVSGVRKLTRRTKNRLRVCNFGHSTKRVRPMDLENWINANTH